MIKYIEDIVGGGDRKGINSFNLISKDLIV